jgi:glutamate dehydrogenase
MSIENLLAVARAEGRVRVSLTVQDGDLVLHVYQHVNLTLSELLPIIDNFGVVVSDEWSSDDDGVRGIDHFRVAGVPGLSHDVVLERQQKLVEGLEAVFAKKMSSDALNKLVLRADLCWQDVDLVRAYVGYAKQIRLPHPVPRVQEILVNRSTALSALVSLFHAKLDPAIREGRAAAIGAATAAVEEQLRQIPTVDEDFVLRFLYNLVEATVRTNFYRDDRVFHYISFKVEHARVRHMPMPRLMVEIYVHHYEMEGVHLRGGPIARGGLRYSDRADFRTEVLGLVTTQMVKNVVIVPEGSKGGFYVKYTIDDPAERKKVGDRLYEVLIRGMLDITDNLVDGNVVRPPNVVAHDGDDPYLVVAADKGTAHLSDTANRLSVAYKFWLGDAFASGGSEGYDHKVMGITARGGWVLVKRLFRELGMDADTQEFTCFGVGDCGGDVFGNGVIETPMMKLLAAFNHLHIFLDPDPDPARSFTERKRLFDGVGGWDKYDTSLISEGGGVFSRRQKLVPLSPQVRAMLGTDEEQLSPNQVINLILKLQVDLFWNGGIGTYVIASTQTNGDAHDPANDDLRVFANELRCKVVGEGGNLGFTQQARIEFAHQHGRINTDFVDNSGGVDTSDHEVNLKILLNPMVQSGRITMEDRNEIIRSMADEVAAFVLENNNQNGRLISLDEVRSARDPFPYGRAIDWVVQRSTTSRHFLSLPSDEELRRRAAANRGLVRPEICVLQAHVKMHVFKLLMQEDPSTIPAFDRLLRDYFPHRMREQFADDLPKHMLAKAIVMTTLLTEVATDAGATYFPMMLELTGASAGRVASSWTEGVRLLNGNDIRRDLIVAHARPEASYAAWTRFTDAILQLVLTWLTPGSDGYAGERESRFNQALDAIASTRSGTDATYAKNTLDRLIGSGIPEAAAGLVVRAGSAARASEICYISARRNETIRDTALLYQALGVASGLTATLRGIAARRGSGRWDPVALGIQRTRYRMLLRELALKSEVKGAALRFGVERGVELVTDDRVRAVADVVAQVVGKEPDVAALLVGEQRIRAVL